MKNRRSRSSILAALSLVTCLAALAGCACWPKPFIPAGTTEPVNILVVWKATSPQIFVLPHRARLLEERQYPVWVLVGAPEGSTLRIEFKSGSPLGPVTPANETKANLPVAKVESAAMTEGPGVVRMGAPKAGTAGKSFKYDVVVTSPDGKVARLDPNIDVDR